MKKIFKFPLIVLGFLLLLWSVARLTNIFQYYNSPTPANEPTIKQGSKFFASNLISPEKLDFICFYADDLNMGKQLRTFRLCGMEGDLVEIKNGDLFVNGQPLDKEINVQHNYQVLRTEYEKIKDLLKIDEEQILSESKEAIVIPIADSFVIRRNIHAVRQVLPKNYEDIEIFKAFNKQWNQDNFGPIKVPADSYFVLGDNRHNALDSRYSGFVKKKDVKATVLWKK
ncbi:MAG: signal peptidase I [Ferruginibacter sp.]